jgi:hypothetical protein
VKRFKNALCQQMPPGAGGWMTDEARRSCIRHGGHTGPHRNRRFEWDEGQIALARPRRP